MKNNKINLKSGQILSFWPLLNMSDNFCHHFWSFNQYFNQIILKTGWNQSMVIKNRSKTMLNWNCLLIGIRFFVVRLELDQNWHLDGLESESLTIQFRSPNRLSLSKCGPNIYAKKQKKTFALICVRLCQREKVLFASTKNN